MRASSLPAVAVVGRPNVGKSSLVNRVLGRREAIVQKRPGVTRDRRAFEAEWNGRRFEIIDTGGLEPGAEGLEARIADQATVAMDAADLILLVVDSTTGPTQDDVAVAKRLQRSSKPVLVVVNKVDSADPSAVADFYSLGLGEPAPVSALHGTGSGDLLEMLVDRLPDVTEDPHEAWASIALVGRPNVGKSSILNALLREERSIVADTPGTTRDPIDSYLRVEDGRLLRLVDTAGMRRQVQVKDPVEYFSLLRAKGTLGRVDAAILVVAADEGVTAPDQKIANEILEAGRACVIALNRWDLVSLEDADRDRYEHRLTDSLRFLTWATTVRTSAKTKRGLHRLLPAVSEAVEAHRHRLPTAEVNRLIRDAQAQRPHPRVAGRGVRILYAVQARTAPPHFLLFSNARLETSYLRYLERRIREVEPFKGTPIRLEVRRRERGAAPA